VHEAGSAHRLDGGIHGPPNPPIWSASDPGE
jgi:hypothetical protein